MTKFASFEIGSKAQSSQMHWTNIIQYENPVANCKSRDTVGILIFTLNFIKLDQM